MPKCRWFIYKRQSTSYPDWVVPDTRSRIVSAAFDGEREKIERLTTEVCSASRHGHTLGLMQAGGSVVQNLHPAGFIVAALRSYFTDVGVTDDGDGGFTNNLTNDPTLSQKGFFSLQRRDGTFSESAMGAVVNTITVAAAENAVAQATVDLLVSDKASVGGQWSDNATAAPATILSASIQSPYPGPLIITRARILEGTSVSLGGNNELILAGGSTVANLRAFTLTINTNTTGVHDAQKSDSPTINRTMAGMLDVSLSAEVGWQDENNTWWEKQRQGTSLAIQIQFASQGEYYRDVGTDPYEMIFTMPAMTVMDANNPQTDGTNTPKTQTVNLSNSQDPTTGLDFGITLKIREDLT
jgi:hypothetical protein